MGSVADNLKRVRDSIAETCIASGRPVDSVDLIAVSKTVDVAAIREAYAAGQRAFGENRIQEWRRKTAELPEDVQWNIIGHLQTNKAKYIIKTDTVLLQSLDRIDLVRDLESLCERHDRVISALVQLNLSREATKSGLYPEDLPRFLDEAANCPRVHLCGLMTIGPNTDNETRIREVFSQAKRIYDDLSLVMPNFCCLSMGMSHDYRLAIWEGSTMVRVGTAIFGARS